tara:strand:- start:1082 stop:1459 length:378 start_codon:yes stop_codon:yes gene_type:complete
MEPLEFTFFIEPPLDFELKKYKVLNYSVKVDELYVNLEFSPWLLKNKMLLLDLKNFINNLETTKRNLTKKRLQFSSNSMFYEYEFPKKIESLDNIEEIIVYSIPIIQRSNDFGTDLSQASGAILW